MQLLQCLPVFTFVLLHLYGCNVESNSHADAFGLNVL